MMWVIVSIPFWVVAALATLTAVACTWCGLDRRMFDRGVALGRLNHSRDFYFWIGVICWTVSGIFALIAAKIAS